MSKYNFLYMYFYTMVTVRIYSTMSFVKRIYDEIAIIKELIGRVDDYLFIYFIFCMHGACYIQYVVACLHTYVHGIVF